MTLRKEDVLLHMHPADQVLLHAGKKGMKWRHRKLPLPGEQNQPGDMTSFQEQSQATMDGVAARLAIAASNKDTKNYAEAIKNGGNSRQAQEYNRRAIDKLNVANAYSKSSRMLKDMDSIHKIHKENSKSGKEKLMSRKKYSNTVQRMLNKYKKAGKWGG